MVTTTTENGNDDNKIDLIISGDTYIYFGDLELVFHAMGECVKNFGYIAFTLEDVNEENEKM